MGNEKKLEAIGFYTLSDERARTASEISPLYRAEMLLTDACNFRCPYCRGLRSDCAGSIGLPDAMNTLDQWIALGLKNVRFSGGEPTLYTGLIDLVEKCWLGGVERIAISTNGSADEMFYNELIDAGVNDFSISLDGCCAAIGDQMAGGINGSWEKVVSNIRLISSRVYTTVGMVFNEVNVDQCIESILFADSLGVADIRVMPSAQYNRALGMLLTLPDAVMDNHPILRYRIGNLMSGIHVRGLSTGDCGKCYLVLDDIAVAGGSGELMFFPCVIYLREGGEPIGTVGPDMRREMAEWVDRHNSFTDPICRSNCLDICRAYNNAAKREKEKEESKWINESKKSAKH